MSQIRGTFVRTLITTAVVVAHQSFSASQLAAQPVQPTIRTDRPDYLVGSRVRIIGAGFVPGEAVTLTVHRSRVFDEHGHPAHEPFTVSANNSGRISASWVLEEGIGVNFRVTAFGSASGVVRPAEFNRVGLLRTDKDSYGPGETGELFGAGFAPGFGVFIMMENGFVTSPVTADANGQIRTTFITDSDSSAATHRILATGEAGGAPLYTMAGFSTTGITVLDDGGPNDIDANILEREADLLSYRFNFRTDVTPRVFDVSIGWDATWLTYRNVPTIHLDANGNGRVDRIIVTEMEEDPIQPIKTSDVFLCADTSVTQCGLFPGSTSVFDQRFGDFRRSWFSVTGGDTIQNIPMKLSEIGLPDNGDEPTIVNVCTNLGANDCVVTPGSGFLTIEALVQDGKANKTITFSLASGTARNGASSWSIRPTSNGENAFGSVPFISIAPGAYGLDAIVPRGLRATDASCDTAEPAVPTEPLPVQGPATIGLDHVVINPGQVTRCRFTLERVPASEHGNKRKERDPIEPRVP